MKELKIHHFYSLWSSLEEIEWQNCLSLRVIMFTRCYRTYQLERLDGAIMYFVYL
jgi:hypothetical protein